MKSRESSQNGSPVPNENTKSEDATEALHSGAAGLDGFGRLETAVLGVGGRALPPVEKWNPPYCGDIGLAIARDGTWSYRGSPIRRMELVKLFASILRRDSDGRHYLVTPVEKVDVLVEDAPLIAVEMEVIGEGREQVLAMRTNLDDVMRIGNAHHLRFAPSDKDEIRPYVRVRGAIEALVTRAVTYELAELITQNDAGRLGVWSDGYFFALQHEASVDDA